MLLVINIGEKKKRYYASLKTTFLLSVPGFNDLCCTLYINAQLQNYLNHSTP